MNAQTHTPGELHLGLHPGPMIYGAKGEQVANLTEPLISKDENMANALRIIRAWNSHDDLVRALVAAVDTMGKIGGPFFADTLEQARAAISRATQ